MKRRDFLKTTVTGVAGVAGVPFLRIPAWPQEVAPATANATVVRAVSRSLDINRKAASVFGLMQSNGTHGLSMNVGDNFDVALHNERPTRRLSIGMACCRPGPWMGFPTCLPRS